MQCGLLKNHLNHFMFQHKMKIVQSLSGFLFCSVSAADFHNKVDF